MIKDIIEKYKCYLNRPELNYEFLFEEILCEIEKSAIQEEALIKALVEDIQNECYSDSCMHDCEKCIVYGKIQLLEIHTGKKWEEIKEVYI